MRPGRHIRQPGMSQGRWYRRAIRGLWPDRNPLRRRSDRLETYLLAGLFVAAAAGAPFAGQAAGHAAYVRALQAEQAQQASSHQVRAVLTRSAGSAVNGYSLSTDVPVQATWTSVTGVKRTGQVLAVAGSPKGSTVTIWTDDAGNLTSPPLQPSQVTGQSDLAALGAVTGVGILYLGGTLVARRVFYKRRMAAWASDWEVTARAWNRQSW